MENQIKRLLTPPFIFLAAFVLWFWEWLWEPLEHFMAMIGRWPLLRQLEAWVARTPRYLALACFLIPGAVLFPFKILGLYFIAHGAAIPGVATFLAAKIVGTALVARIFSLTRPQLMGIGWFARAYGAVTRFRNHVFDILHKSPIYQRTRAALSALRQRLSGVRRGVLFRVIRRWKAARRMARRRGR
jgi:hypothetical protein